jgi:hypothetical protein
MSARSPDVKDAFVLEGSEVSSLVDGSVCHPDETCLFVEAT